jgi:tetratricopeptide (TPR) repeat protein
MTDAPASPPVPLAPPLPEKKYYAFVSYSSQDKRWGRWLHGQLENYVIPRKVRALAAEQGRELPKRLRPCFRDRDELAGAADLGEKIGQALRETRYLVVLCSKRSARSEWVNKEIEDFRALDPENKDRILALILDGVPNATSNPAVDDAEECFPPALRLPLEPLAGDLRPEGDGRERGFIKILAGITGMDFDQFYRRHERREQQIRAVWTTVAVSLILGFAGLAAFALLQRQEAIRQRDLAVARAETIKENVDWMNFQLRDILRRYAPSGVAVEANERIDTMLRAVETGAGEGTPKTWLEIQGDRVRRALGVPTEAGRPDLVVLEARMQANLQKAEAILLNSEADPAQALPLLESARQMAEELGRLDPANTQFRRDVSVSYSNLADVQLRLGQTAQALSFYEKALAVAEGLVKLYPKNTQFRRDVSVACSKLGGVQMTLGDTAHALGFYEKALAIDEELVKLDPENTEFRRNVGLSYGEIGDVKLQLGDTAQALGSCEKALAVAEGLVRLDPDNTEFRHDVSVSYIQLGDVKRQLGNSDQALGFYEKGLAEAEELVRLDPENTEFREVVGVSYNRLGGLQLQLGYTVKALGTYEKFLQGFEQLVKLDPANTQFRRGVSFSYINLGDVHLQLGDTAQALGFYEKALAVAEELVKLDSANTEFRRDVAVSHAKLGQLREAQGAEGRAAALAHYREGMEIFEGMKAAGALAPADEESIAELRAKVAELE